MPRHSWQGSPARAHTRLWRHGAAPNPTLPVAARIRYVTRALLRYTRLGDEGGPTLRSPRTLPSKMPVAGRLKKPPARLPDPSPP